jgi:hypothetical protein
MNMDVSSSECSFASTSLKWRELCCGTVRSDSWAQFEAVFERLLDKAQRLTGDQRTAAKRAGQEDTQGHQKTPAFIDAVIKDAIEAVFIGQQCPRVASQPRGAFTDVGLHTGGQRRETSWPLAHAVIGTFLQQSITEEWANSDRIKREMLELQLFLMRESWVGGRLNTISPRVILGDVTVHCGRGDLAMQMIASTALRGAELSDKGYHIGLLESQLAELRCELDHAISSHHVEAAKTFSLPSKACLENCMASTQHPELPFPPVAEVNDSATNHDEYRRMALQNLGTFDCGKKRDQKTCTSMLEWLNSVR